MFGCWLEVEVLFELLKRKGCNSMYACVERVGTT